MDQKIAHIVERVKRALEASGIAVERVVLFGSHAAGTADEQSDIDLAVISPDFQGLDILARQEAVGRALAKARIMDPVEVLAYSPQEYEAGERGTFLGEEITAKGVPVA